MRSRIIQKILCAAKHWSSDNVSTTGAALAYYCAFSLAPLIVILLALAGPILGHEAAYSRLSVQLTALVGAGAAATLLTAVKSTQEMHGIISTITSVITLLIGATTVLSVLQTVLDQIWQSGKLVRTGAWGWIRARFLSLGFILALGFLLLVSLTISTALSGLQHHFSSERGLLIGVVAVLDFLVSVIVIGTLFALIFRYMPARRLEWRWAAVGGILTALLFEVGRWLVGWYLGHSTQPTAFGAASSFVALLVWLYYTGQIFLFGAEFTACLAGLRDADSERAISSVSSSGFSS